MVENKLTLFKKLAFVQGKCIPLGLISFKQQEQALALHTYSELLTCSDGVPKIQIKQPVFVL